MCTSVIVVFAQLSGTGHALRLTVGKSAGKGIVCEGIETDLDLDIAAQRAFIAAWQILGKPAHLPGAKCTFAALDSKATVPPLKGGSLYGAFALAFVQFFALDGYKYPMPHQIRAQLDRGMQSSDLSKVAVSAEGDFATGEFRLVEGIDQKLEALANLEDLSVCVLARGQMVPSIVKGSNGTYIVDRVTPEKFLEKFRESQNKPKIPIIYAVDAMDALGQIFDRQCKALAHGGVT